jgi:hypothetical protein
VARLREALNEGNNPEAVEVARALIDRVIIHPTPRGTPPRITVERHLAQMLTPLSQTYRPKPPRPSQQLPNCR